MRGEVGGIRVVVAHNFYRQAGGEDEVFEAECLLLERHGHEVHRVTLHSDGAATIPAAAVRRGPWARTMYRSEQIP